MTFFLQKNVTIESKKLCNTDSNKRLDHSDKHQILEGPRLACSVLV